MAKGGGPGPIQAPSAGISADAVVREFTAPLRSFFHRRSHDLDAVETLVQETFYRVHKYLHAYNPARKLSSWIFAIAANLHRDFLRSQPPPSVPLLEDLLALPPEGPGHPESEAEAREVRRAVIACVQALEPRLRSVFVLRHHYELSNGEIARLLSIPEGTVKSRMHAACRELREALAGRGMAPVLRTRAESSGGDAA